MSLARPKLFRQNLTMSSQKASVTIAAQRIRCAYIFRSRSCFFHKDRISDPINGSG